MVVCIYYFDMDVLIFRIKNLEKDVISKLSMVQYLSIIFEVFRVWLFKTGCYDKWAQGQAY